MGPQEDYIETVVTCEGDYHDPELHKRLEEFRQSLQDLLYTDEDKLILKKVEPWNSVRVTFKISREAALRLKHLAQQGNATLRQLGVLAVQIQGDQAISLTIAGRNNERTELIIQTSSTPGPPTVSFTDPILPGGEELNSPSPSNVEATRKNIADYLRQGQALQQGSNLVETLFGPGALGQNSDVFRSPSLVASTQSGHPFRSGGTVSSSPSTPPSTTAISPSLPYLSTFPQGRSPPGFSQGSAFPGPPISSPGPSTGPMGMKFPPPSFPQQQDMGPYPPMDLMGLPPPPPYPHSTAVVNNISRPARTVTASSPLLVNLLQTDPMGVGMNSMSPLKMLPPSGEGGPPPKKKRRPRKKPAATVTSGSLLEEEQPQPGLASSPVPEPSPVPVPLDAPPSVPLPLPASSSSQDADNPSMDEEHPFLNPADPNAVFPPSSHRMSPELPVIPLTSSAVGLELGLPTEQPESMDTGESVEATPVVSEALVSPVQQTAPMEIDAVEMNHGDGKLVNPVTGDLEAVDTTSDLSPVKERDQASLVQEIPAQEETLGQTRTVITTTTSQSVTLSQPVPQTAAPAVTAVQTTVVDSVRISGLPGTSHPQPSPSSNLSQVPVTCVAQSTVTSVQNSLSLEDPALYASSSQQAEVSASVRLTTSVAMTHSASSLPVASSACSPAVAPSVVHTAVSNPVTPSQPLSVIATQSSSAHTSSPSPQDTSAGGQPAVERRREGSEEAKVVVSEGMSQPGGSEAVSQTSPSSSKADPYMSLSSPSTRNNSASPNASPDNKDPSEGDENSNHSDSGICNDISPDMGTSQGSLLDSTGNKVYNHDSGIGSSSERSDDTPSEPGDNEYRSSHVGAEKEECSKSQKLVNCKQEAKVITVGYVMNNDHHSALNKDKNDLAAVQELKDRVPSLVRGDESHHGPNQVTVNVVHLAGKDQKNLVEPVKSMAQNLAPSHVFNSQQEPMKNGPQGEKKSVSPPTEDVRCRKQVKSPVQPDSRTQNHAHVDEESSLKDSPVQQSNMALAPATSRHLLSNGPVTKSPEEASEADKHHPDMEICSEQPPPASTLRNDTTQASESMEMAEDQPAHLIPEDEIAEMKEVTRLAFNAQLVPEGQALAVEGAAGLLDGRYQARSPREMMEVEGGRTSPSGVGRGRGSPPESLRGSNITSMYSKQTVPVNVNLLNHIYSAGLPPPRRLTESVQRLVKPLPSIDSGMPQMRSCKSPGNTAPKQASSMSGSSPRSIHSGARSPGASARTGVESKMNSSAAGVSMANSLPYLQYGGGGPTTAVAYSPGMGGVSVASSTAYSGSPMTLVPPLTALVQGLNPAPRSLCEVSQPSMELLEQSEGLDSAATRVVPTILDKPTHVMFNVNVSRASDAPLCAVAETVMSSQTATSTCSPQASSHPNPHLQPLTPKSSVQPNPLPSDPVPSSCNRQCEDGVPRTAVPDALLPASIHPTPSSCAMNHNVSSSASDLGHSTVGHNSSLEGLAGHISPPEPAVTPVSAGNAVVPATTHAGAHSCPKDSGPSQTLPSVQHSTCTVTHNFAEVLRRMASPTIHPVPVPPTAPPPPTPPLPSVSISASNQAHVDSEAMSLGSEVHPPLPPPPPTPPPPPPLPTDPYPHSSSEVDSSGVTVCTEVNFSDAAGSGSADFSVEAYVSRIEETLHLYQTAAGNRDLSGTEANGSPNGSSSGQQSSNLCTSKAAESECDRQMQDTLSAVPATASHPAVVAGQPSNDSHGAPSVQSDPVVSIQPPTSVNDLPAEQVRPTPAPSQDSTANSTRSVPMEIDQTPVAPPAKKMKVEKSDSVSSESSVQVSQAPTVSGETLKSVKVSKTVSHVTKTNPKGSGGKNKGSAVPVKTETAPPAMADVEMTPDPHHSEAQGKVPVSIDSQSSSSSRGPIPAASEKSSVPDNAEQAAPTPTVSVVAPLSAAAGKAGQNGAAAKASAAPQTPAASPTAKTGVSPKATTKTDPAASSAKQPPAQAQKEGHSQQEGKKTATAGTGMKTRESPGRAVVADVQKKEPSANATGAPAATAAKSAASLPPPLVSKPSESAPAPPTGSSEEQHAERPVRMTRKRRRTQSDSEPEHTPASLPVTANTTTSTSAAPSTSSSTASVPSSAALSSTSSSTPALAAALMAPTLMDTKPDVTVSTVASAMETEKAAAPSTESHTGSGMRLRETRRHSSGSETKHRSSSEEASESTPAEKTAVEKNVVEKASGEKSVVEKSHVEKHAEKSAAEKPAAEKNSSEKTAAEKGAAEKKMDGSSKEEELGRKPPTGRRQRGMPTSGQTYFQCLIMQGRTRSQSAPKGEKEKDKEKESKEQNQPPPPAPAKEDAAAAVPTTTAASGAAAAAAGAAAASDGQKRPTRNLRQKDTPDQQPAAKRRRPRDPR